MPQLVVSHIAIETAQVGGGCCGTPLWAVSAVSAGGVVCAVTMRWARVDVTPCWLGVEPGSLLVRLSSGWLARGTETMQMCEGR
jgi:hypothetical protein